VPEGRPRGLSADAGAQVLSEEDWFETLSNAMLFSVISAMTE